MCVEVDSCLAAGGGIMLEGLGGSCLCYAIVCAVLK